ncbi:MAG TPA: DUF4185 domain-containing protein [Candidatus Paceibacterota bacterium]|nr:DUF4185 domain-containing protein [Verrucomicrobiota bacterium]HSA12008.1 DUF4185 domain-containing protein [Candidatus Paceibacterota bacterium]
MNEAALRFARVLGACHRRTQNARELSHSKSRWHCASFFVWALTLLAALQVEAASEPAGRAAPEWDALFQRESGWIGADGNYSIPLARDTTLWLFSDTFVGKVKDGKRHDASMINNSLALQKGTNTPQFFFGTTPDGKPASFIKPQRGTGRDYFWLAHGARNAQGLYFFMLRVVTMRTDTPFGFKLVDGWLAHVANPDDAPPQWRITQTKVPFTKISKDGALIFGGAVLSEGGYAYLFGGDSRSKAKKAGHPNGLVVARVPLDRLSDFTQWRFLANGAWLKDCQRVTPLFPNVGSEFSVSWLPSRKAYAAVYSEGIGGNILVRLAPALTGPWGQPVRVYRCPEMDWPSKAFCYAAKAHPALANAADELLITYAANAWNFWDLFKDARLYWPRFVRVSLRAD